jgi:hypothetical protein
MDLRLLSALDARIFDVSVCFHWYHRYDVVLARRAIRKVFTGSRSFPKKFASKRFL